MSKINLSLDVDSSPVVITRKSDADKEVEQRIRLQALLQLAKCYTLLLLLLVIGLGYVAFDAVRSQENLTRQLVNRSVHLNIVATDFRELAIAHRDLRQLTRFHPTGSDAWELKNVEVTAYTACDPGDPCGGVTASGLPADHNLDIIAINHLDIPFDSKVWIHGIGWKNAKDRICWKTCDKVTNSIDILMATRREALKWGRKPSVPVLVMKPEIDV